MSVVSLTWITAGDIAEGTVGWEARERSLRNGEKQRRRKIEGKV